MILGIKQEYHDVIGGGEGMRVVKWFVNDGS